MIALERVISISLGEVALKGLNRGYFENMLIRQIKNITKKYGNPRIYREQGKIYIQAEYKYFDDIIPKVKNIFGIAYVSPCIKIEKNMNDIEKASILATKEAVGRENIETFKVQTKRIDKNFPIKSPEVSKKIGSVILNENMGINVDVHNPDIYVYIDIKDNCYVYTQRFKGYGGLPVGTNGKGLLLLSGGIDSPVAGFMMAKRGVKLSAVHYHSYPFTSERAEEKVKDLAKILSIYCGDIKLYSVNILNIQKEINDKCPEDEMTIISRRFMTKIAERIALKEELDALVTGESLGQVASQTIKGLSVTDRSVKLPIFRPLIGLDKVEIIDIAKDIGTYETSILPYEDCCTVFLPKHPVTRPKLEDIEESEKNLDVEKIIEEALKTMKIVKIEP